MVFHLPLRQTEGFLRSLADMHEVEIPIPDHTTLSRGLKTLGEVPLRAVASHRRIHLLTRQYGSQDSRHQSAEATEKQGLAEAAPCG
jgi:hypothetical protein